MDEEERYKLLLREIEKERQKSVLGIQEIPESVLDSLKKELNDLLKKNPDLQKLGTIDYVTKEPIKEFLSENHSSFVWSLQDVFNFEELLDWDKRNKNFYEKTFQEKPNWTYSIELKLDGLTLILIYKERILHKAITRGDGFRGENVTENARTIRNIPKVLPGFAPENLEIRGEVVILKSDFEEINKEQEKLGLEKFSNPRNLATGSLKLLDPNIVEKRRLSFFAYEIRIPKINESHFKDHELLSEFGFESVKAWEFDSLEKIWQKYEELTRKRNSFDFWCDGTVILVSQKTFLQNLGIVGKGPRGGVALKFPSEEVATVLLDVTWQVGRTGIITPVAELKEVLLAGTNVKRASLHSVEEIKKLGVKIGDTVVVKKAGDIIPKVTFVMKNFRTGEEKEIEIPKNCPVCNSIVFSEGNGVMILCKNKLCWAQNLGRLIHFASKKAFDFESLGEKIIEKFYNDGLLKNFSDFFRLKKEDILKFDGFKDTLSEKIINSIQQKRKISLSRFLYSLGVRGLGEVSSKDLANFLKARGVKDMKTLVEALKVLKSDDYDKIEGVAEKTAQNWEEDLSNKETLEEILNLSNQGVEIFNEENAIENAKVSGKTFLFTGTLNTFSREKAKELVEKNGGKVVTSISKNLDFLVVGENPGSKLEKAKSLGIKILNESEFLEIVGFLT